MNLRGSLVLVLLASTEVLMACGPSHIAPFTARQRKYEAGEYAQNLRGSQPAEGSIYTEAKIGRAHV
jgi:hypothetical protein